MANSTYLGRNADGEFEFELNLHVLNLSRNVFTKRQGQKNLDGRMDRTL